MLIQRIFLTIFSIIVIFTSNSFAQKNFVPNGDFEEYSSLPNDPGQWYKCKNWSSINEFQGFDGVHGSPDYFHTFGSGGFSPPFTSLGEVLPYSGNAIMGFVGFHNAAINFREYLSVKLADSLIVGDPYHISYWITNGYYNPQGGYSCNNVGVLFTTYAPIQIDHESIIGYSQFKVEEEIWSTTWKNITYDFIADSAYTYFSIGNFMPDDSTSYSNRYPIGAPFAYYFIDKVEVVGEEEIIPEIIEMPNIFTPNSDGSNDIFMPIKIQGVHELELVIYNRWGKLVFKSSENLKWDGTNNSNPAPEGVYFWVLKYKDKDGLEFYKSGNLSLIR